MRTQLILGVLAASLLASCSSETGMIISTTTAEDFDGDIATLRYYIGEENINFRTGLSDTDLLDDIDVSNLDLGRAPFRLLLRPDGDATESIKVVAVSFDQEGRISGFGEIFDMVQFVPDSVIQWDLVLESARPNVVITPTDCLRWIEEDGEWNFIGVGDDQDCDGIYSPEDCDDLDPTLSPDKAEICDNGIDDNCNGDIDMDDTSDGDNDGFPACGAEVTDCNDNDENVNPAAPEVCDGVDNDCDGACDSGSDGDKDGVSTCGSLIEYAADDSNVGTCASQGALGPIDCDDTNDQRFPGNAELCDGIDNNCDRGCDDEDVFDYDGDGYTSCDDNVGSLVGTCAGTAPQWNDCQPMKEYIHPGAHDLCDGLDNNCDGQIDPVVTPCFAYASGNGGCYDGTRNCQGGQPTGECQLNSTARESFDMEWCSGYQTCAGNGSLSDPFVCSIDQSYDTGPIVEVCQVRMNSAGTMCPATPVPIALPFANPTLCEYSIIGGTHQQGYEVGFRNLGPTSAISPTRNECGGALSVNLSPLGQWPGEASFSISYADAMGQTEVQVQLVPLLVDTCADDVGNLECGSWALPVMP